jgi:hypothetical protein
MKSPFRLLTAFAVLALAGALHCGAPQPAQPSPRGAFDSDTGESTDRPKAKARPSRPAPPAEIVTLSLEGIPVLKKAEAPAGAEDDTAAQPAPGTIGPPLPPKEDEDEAPGGSPGEKAKEGNAAPEQPATPAGIAAPPRNLFAFEEDPAVVLDRQKKAEEAAQLAAEAAKRAAEERQQQAENAKLHPPPPQPPAITFQFIGYMGPPEERIGVFATPGLLLARKGDTILGKFKIVSIGYESAEIGFTGFTQTQRIPLFAGGK